MPASLKNDPLFNVPKKYTDNYKYILNVSPAVVNTAHPDLRGVQGGVDGLWVPRSGDGCGRDGRRAETGGAGRGASRPRYPTWLTLPSLLYYAIFFLGPMAILAVFSVSIQSGFGSVSYAFDLSQYHQVFSSRSTSRSSGTRW